MTDQPTVSPEHIEPQPPLVVLGTDIQNRFPDVVSGFDYAYGELSVSVAKAGLLAVMAYLRDAPELRFAQLIDVCGVDYPDRAERFDVVYQLLSLKHNMRIRVKVSTDEETPIASVSSLFSSAAWFERETWDMYGVMFDGLVDHRRILTDYGFNGHPLRKEFPLSGHVEVRYDEAEKRVVYGPVSLPQDFRVFDNLSPWEALTDVQLPGDEKANYVPKIGWKPTSKDVE